MGIGHLPDLAFASDVEASDVAISPSCDHSSIIFCNCAAHASLHFRMLHRCDSFVFRKIPDLNGAALVDGNEIIAVFPEANVVNGRAVSV